MGEGRAPVMQPELEGHLRGLGGALRAAVERDFGVAAVGGEPLGAPFLESVARRHAQGLYTHQQAMGVRLAEANVAGEVGRKDEMKRIFGIDL